MWTCRSITISSADQVGHYHQQSLTSGICLANTHKAAQEMKIVKFSRQAYLFPFTSKYLANISIR